MITSMTPTKSQRPGRVLIVDDETSVSEVISKQLTKAGHSCATAANADLAWQHVQKNPTDLITLDLRMPGRSGTDLLREIHQEFPDMAVVVLTGRTDAENAITALTLGASAYLMKPVDFTELIFHADRALERRNLILERRLYTEKLEEKVAQQTDIIRGAHEETIRRLVNASMHRDEETGTHIRRVGLCSELFARSLGWSSADAAMIRMAAPMHDVGKIGIPDSVLQKPGKLTKEEFEVMKSHTTIGASMLADSDSPILQLAEQIARSHHERWDGTGYPDGLSGVSIPPAARVVAIVDVYDALTHDRVYRPAMPEAQALKILKGGSGTHFDSEMLSVFLRILPEIREVRWRNPETLGRSRPLFNLDASIEALSYITP